MGVANGARTVPQAVSQISGSGVAAQSGIKTERAARPRFAADLFVRIQLEFWLPFGNQAMAICSDQPSAEKGYGRNQANPD